MKTPVERQNLRLMQRMFGRIAPRYDLVTRLFSYGMDRQWKRLGVARAAIPERPVVLDLASGTGDFSKLVRERFSQARTVAADLTERMLALAKTQGVAETVCSEAAALPFHDEVFDCVFVGYGLRNFTDLTASLREIERVTRPGGVMVSLDFFLPSNRWLRTLYLAYLYTQGAFWGLMLHGRPRTYTYIADSLRHFVSLDELSERLRSAGYARVESQPYIFGGIGLHWAVKR